MKYLVNFQVEITLKSGKKNRVRSTFTVIEEELKDVTENNFDMIKSWFINYFSKNDLDKFIDASNINESYTTKIKIGRITNSIDGQYKTF